MDTTKRKYQKHKKGYSISINYYLRKDRDTWSFLKKNESHDGIVKYPLYIRVAFLGQTVKLRSRLDVQLADDEFETYIATPNVAEFIKVESASIQYSIEELQPDTIENFRNSQWSTFYNDGCTSIVDCIEDVAIDKFRKLLQKKFDLHEADTVPFLQITNGLSAIELLSRIGVKPAVTIIQQFDPLIKALSSLNKLRLPHSKGSEYVLWDWKTGYLQDIMATHFSHEASALIKSLESVLIDYEAIAHSTSLK